MALKHNKVVNLTAESQIEGQTVARFSATVNSETDVNSGYSEQILDTGLYNAHKAAVREDIREFRTLIFDLEDQLESENEEVEAPIEEPEDEPVE